MHGMAWHGSMPGKLRGEDSTQAAFGCGMHPSPPVPVTASHSAALDTRDPGRAVSEARPTYRETAVRRRRRERAPARAPQRRCALVVPAPPPSSPAHRLASGRPGGKLWQRFLMGQTLNPTAYTFIPRRARLWEGITTHPCIQAHAHASARSTG
jgi:hypothetical protein